MKSSNSLLACASWPACQKQTDEQGVADEPADGESRPAGLRSSDEPWIGNYRPYVYQSQVYQAVQETLTGRETRCLFLVTPTGSGKTLASYAYTVNHHTPAFGVYPTNELIQTRNGL